MFRPRLIPVLLIKDGALIKTKKFKSSVYIGDPINAVKIFNELKADELIFLDISATKEKRLISLDLISAVGEEANMPFAVGGGIATIEDIRKIINIGAERVVLGSAVVQNPRFIKESTDYFGSSTISVCIDVKKNFFGKHFVYYKNGSIASKYNPRNFAVIVEECGAGEIILQSISNDGMRCGYDIDLLRSVSEVLSIPIVALGGAGSIEDFKTVYQKGYVNGIAAGSEFVFHGDKEGVLINYPKKEDIINLFSFKK